MLRVAISQLLPFLSGRARMALLVVAIGSLAAGLFEATLLVLVVSVALAVAEGESAIDLEVPVLTGLELAPQMALSVAVGAGLTMLSLHLLLAWLTAHLSSGVLQSARTRVMSAFTRASWERQAQDREGALQEAVSTLSNESATLLMHFSHFVSSSIALAMLLLIALVVDPLITAVVLFVGALLFFGLRPVSRLTQTHSRTYVHQNSGLNEQVTQWSSLALELRVFGVEQEQLRLMSEQAARTSTALTRSRFMTRAGSELYKDLAILFLVGAVAALHWTDVDLAAVGAVVLLIVRSLSYAQMTNTALQSINELGPNLESLSRRLESLDRAAEHQGTMPLESIGRIELEGVGYDYEPGRPGIEDVTLAIDAGEAIGVIGPSGGGKTTLVQVLLRLRPPHRGRIAVSGMPYEEVSAQSWRSLTAVVPQEPKLFQGSVAENISFFRPEFTRREIERAAESARVLEDLKRLPEGLDTQLGPRGAGLSGGQKQRVAFARALLGDPQLLVLDEPTSALDVHSEELLQQTIEGLKGHVTMVIIAHRLTTLACCDRVVALENGSVKLIGTLEEALRATSNSNGIGLLPPRQDTPGTDA